MNIAIIGATRGLGLCLTRILLEKGCRVAVGAHNMTPGLKKLADQYKNSLLIFSADVTDEKQIAEGARKCGDFLGKIDSVCTVAGILLDGDRSKPLHKCDIVELRKTLDVNVVGPVIVIKRFYPYLRTGANIFTITSEGAGISNCGTWVPCYGLSKTAATKISGVMNASVKNANFYSVHPGRMNTDMGKMTAQIEPEEAAQGLCRLICNEIAISRDHWYIDYNGNEMPY